MPRKLSNRTRNVNEKWPGSAVFRRAYVVVTSYNHKPEWPKGRVQNPYSLSLAVADRNMDWPLDGNGNDRRLDLPNIAPYYYMHNDGWDERLYAGVYSKFMDAARQGSAEVAMNTIQYRQTLRMLVHYVLTSKDLIRTIRSGYRHAWKWLTAHPSATANSVRRRRKSLREKKTRRSGLSGREEKELRILDEVSGALLAYRYGVAPLMADIAAVCDILSKEYNGDVVYRKSNWKTWGPKYTYPSEGYVVDGQERVTLTGRCSVTNPNLLLANRLGLINPQQWLWDATPWSFVVDWWFPVGTFLGNFTASVGLSVYDSSVTRTREGSVNVRRLMGGPQLYWATGTCKIKRKIRSGGPFPQPFSVPYGTGLGIQRAQNALALIMQMFSSKLKKG